MRSCDQPPVRPCGTHHVLTCRLLYCPTCQPVQYDLTATGVEKSGRRVPASNTMTLSTPNASPPPASPLRLVSAQATSLTRGTATAAAQPANMFAKVGALWWAGGHSAAAADAAVCTCVYQSQRSAREAWLAGFFVQRIRTHSCLLLVQPVGVSVEYVRHRLV